MGRAPVRAWGTRRGSNPGRWPGGGAWFVLLRGCPGPASRARRLGDGQVQQKLLNWTEKVTRGRDRENPRRDLSHPVALDITPGASGRSQCPGPLQFQATIRGPGMGVASERRLGTVTWSFPRARRRSPAEVRAGREGALLPSPCTRCPVAWLPAEAHRVCTLHGEGASGLWCLWSGVDGSLCAGLASARTIGCHEGAAFTAHNFRSPGNCCPAPSL